MSREAVLNLLEGAARHLDALADAHGHRICPAHRVEHLGKTAYRIHMGLALHAHRGAPLDEVKRTALRLAETCHKYPHPEARAYLFFERWPDPFNCSNHLIDSGAVCDALGKLLVEAPELLSDEELARVRDALEKSASTYLWAASLDKPVPAQCLWGALGMARASVALEKRELADRAREAVLRSYESLAPDGSWSYYTAGAEPGSEDASAFYHSRCIGFALETLALIGDDATLEPHRGKLEAALEFLLALHRADDTKCRAWEAKLWYFDGDAETASLAFDVHALLLGERAFGGGRYAARAARSLALLTAAQGEDGAIDGGAERAFQCPTFWTSHVGLLASVVDDLGQEDAPLGECEPTRALFPDAGLGRLTHGDRVVLVRGGRPRPSPGFGGVAGGGARVADGSAEGESELPTAPTVHSVGEHVAPAVFGLLPLRPGGLAWLRFSRWRLRCALRAEGLGAALALARATLGQVLCWWTPAAASHFASDVELELENGELLCRGSLASIDGNALPGTRTTRRYRLDAEGLHVHELLESEQALAQVRYVVPPGAVDLRIDECDETVLLVERNGVRRLELAYRLP